MTEPTTLNYDQLCQYTRQLQQTVQFWQSQTARAMGFGSRETMIAFLKCTPAVDATEAKVGLDTDWLAEK